MTRPAYYKHRWRKVGDVMFEMWWRNGVPFATPSEKVSRTFLTCFTLRLYRSEAHDERREHSMNPGRTC